MFVAEAILNRATKNKRGELMKKISRTNMGMVIFNLVIAGVLVLSACGPSATPEPTQDVALIQTQAAQTVVANITQNAPPPTQAPPPTATATPPPPGPTPDPNIPVAVVPTPAPGEPAAIANYNTTIYSGPGTNYVVYAAFLGGKTAKVVGKSADGLWWAISVPVAPNGSGWVDAGWVTVTNAGSVSVLPTPPVPPTVDMVPPGPSDPQAIAIANIYIRTGPAANYPAYGIASAGASGRVIGKSEDGQWWVVRLDPSKVGAGYGWVMTQYTQAINVAEVQTIKNPVTYSVAPPPPPATGVPAATALDFVNIRSGPGTNYAVLVVAPPGASGEVSGKSSDGAWWQVKISTVYSANGFGWVSADWVYTQNTDNVPVVEAPAAPPAIEATPPASNPTYGCVLIAQSPTDYTQFNPGAGFSTTWVLQNTSVGNWTTTDVDVRYVGAVANTPLHQGSDAYDLALDVKPNETYNFTVPMIAPYSTGTYGELWEIGMGDTALCQFYVYIQVK
jgi:uncharacterized protein YraI